MGFIFPNPESGNQLEVQALSWLATTEARTKSLANVKTVLTTTCCLSMAVQHYHLLVSPTASLPARINAEMLRLMVVVDQVARLKKVLV